MSPIAAAREGALITALAACTVVALVVGATKDHGTRLLMWVADNYPRRHA